MRWLQVCAIGGLLGCSPSVAQSDGSDTGSSGGGCVVGTIACDCTPGGGCDPGLMCVVGVCIPQELDTSITSPTIGEAESTPPDSGSSVDDESSSASVGTSESGSSDGSSSSESSTTGVPLPCGNGRLEDPEVCDDGNTVDGDGCNSDCLPGGQEMWTQIYEGGMLLEDWGHRVAIDADDDVYVTGIAFDPGNSQRDAILIKYDDDGQEQWTERYDSGLGPDTDMFWGVAIAADQTVVVAGCTGTAALLTRPIVRMYSEDGDPLWTYVEPDGSDSCAYDVVIDSIGDIIVTGYAHDLVDYHAQAWLAKLDPSDGAPIWNLRFDAPVNNGNVVLAIDEADAMFIGGGSTNTAYVRKLDGDANEIWTWMDALAGNSAINDIDAGPDDDIAAAGSQLDNPLNVYVARHPSAGVDPDWTESWSGDMGGAAWAGGVAYDSAGRVVIGGWESAAGGGGALFARKYEVGGDEVWTNEEPDTYGNGNIFGVAVDSLDQPVIVGRISETGNNDIFVRKLTQ